MKKSLLLSLSGVFIVSCASAQWTVSGNNIYNSNTGNVGVGVTNPNGKLDVNGALLFPGSLSNNMTRPGISAVRITGEVSGYGSDLIRDDGFLRISAGGGTNASIAKSFIDISGYSQVPDMDRNIILGTGGNERMRIDRDGNISIGTSDPKGYKLAINGGAVATSFTVKSNGKWPDYVFDKSYHLPSLVLLKQFITKYNRLPEMPSAKEVSSNGIDLGETNKILTKRLEELTLHMINLNEQLAEYVKLLHRQDIELRKQKNVLRKLSQQTSK